MGFKMKTNKSYDAQLLQLKELTWDGYLISKNDRDKLLKE